MNIGLLKEHHIIVALIHRISDICVIMFGFVASAYLTFGYIWPKPNYIITLFLCILIAFWLYPSLGLYRTWRGESKFKEIGLALNCWTLNLLTLGFICYLSGISLDYDNKFFLYWYGVGAISFVLVRFSIRLFLNHFRSKGRNQRHVIVIGDGKTAIDLINKVKSSAWTGYSIIGHFGEQTIEGTAQLGGVDQIEEYISGDGKDIDQIWIAMPLSEELVIERIIVSLRHATQTVRYVPDINGFRLINHSVSDVVGVPVINVSISPIDGGSRILKALEDKILSGLILLLISPILLAVAIGVKLTSPGPVFYRQERVSWNGKTFMMLKFRSMPQNSEKDGVKWGSAKTKTTTKFGQFIRKTSLDELPQFINVLKGDMSIVGPRPERTVFVEQFKEEIPGYMQKHMVKAGITGWAQINGWRGDTDLKRRVECDLYYIDNWSIRFDLKIIFLTAFKSFFDKNAY
jgi:putative colanic acid biosynthesis UDP-glucose lipid carrier transferase